MNKIYRLVWNAVQRAWVVAGEFATAKGKGKTMPRRLSVKLAGVAGAGMVALLAVEPSRAWMIDPVAILNGSAATDNGNSTNTAIGDNAIASSSANNGAITALGWNARAMADWSTALGANSLAEANESTAIGQSAKVYSATSTYSTVIGSNAGISANSPVATVVGSYAIGTGMGATVLGAQSQALGKKAVAVGHAAAAVGEGAMALGGDSQALKAGALAAGYGAKANTQNDIAIGTNASANGPGAEGYEVTGNVSAIAIGTGSVAAPAAGAPGATYGPIAIGAYAQALGSGATAIGYKASATREDTTAIGSESTASGARSTAIGQYSQASGQDSIAIGHNSNASDSRSVALGQASASGMYSMALGHMAKATQMSGLAIGMGSSATVSDGVALGSSSVANKNGGYAGYRPAGTSAAQAAAITATTSNLGAVSVGDVSNNKFRQIIGVAAGTMDSDAVNVAQLRALAETPLTFTGNTGTVAKKLGETLTVQGTGTTAGTYSGNNLKTTVDGAGVMQLQMADNPEFTTAKIGNNTLLNSTGLIVTGGPSVTTTGINAGSKKITNVAAGDISATSTEAINGSQLNTIFTTGTKYFHANSTGTDSVASGADAVAIGMGAVASASKSVALGAGSLANGNTLSHQAYLVGGTAQAEVNVGDRRITGLSAGADDTDAVNVAQLRAVSAGAVGDAVMYDSTAHNRVTLGGDTYNSDTHTGGAKITNVANGTAPSDAVNFSQLNTIYTTGTKYFHANSTGIDSQATGADAIAVGQAAQASGVDSMALGAASQASGAGSFAAGYTAKALTKNDIAIGTNASASGSLADSDVNYDLSSIAIGRNSTALSLFSPGQGAIAGGGQIAIGDSATSLGHASIALGVGATSGNSVSAGFNIAIGLNARALNANDTAIGDSANATGFYSLALGTRAKASGHASMAMGLNAEASGLDATAIGRFSYASGARSVALAGEARASGDTSMALGYTSMAYRDGSVALGSGSIANKAAGIAGFIPAGTNAERTAAIAATTSNLAGVSVGNADYGQFRQIHSVAAGAADSDAVNVAQLKATTADIVLYDNSAHNSVTLGGSGAAAPVALTNVAAGSTPNDAVNFSQLNSIDTTGTKYFHANSTGTDSFASGADAVAIGMGAIASADNSVALGAGSLADGSTLSHQAYLVGGTARAEVNVGDRRITGLSAGADDADAVNLAQLRQVTAGSVADAVVYDSTAHNRVTLGGTGATAPVALTNVANGVAASDAVNVSQLTELTNTGTKYFHANSTGTDSSATGQDAVAIGMGAVASADNSVALGAGSLADGSTLSQQAYLVGGTATGEVNVGDRR
ncbi:ESPR-type extended signal peptide-containing protein, partial [Buttiauxella gaviniae]|uniref:ESPR-type extended signal peptide-containing protein n=1 Tax=Buttiauxella gaviniae TaxID=82990 RepID=UPI003C74BAC8